MKQVAIQGGRVRVIEVPAPQVGPGSVLVQVEHSCISAGTEVTGVQAATMSVFRRALRQPEKVNRALQMIRERGLRETLDRARGETAVVPLGYSAAGIVLATGAEVVGFAPGERVACAGAGFANHAEVIDVPVNLAVRIPDGLDTSLASTVALGAIAMQGVRRAAPAISETVLVAGLGLLGQLTVQLLKANGCRAIGVDPDPARVSAARNAGMDASVVYSAEGYAADVFRLTDGFGVDAAIVTAATPSHDVINHAMRACRRKGRVVLVGDVGLNLQRDALYAKELDLLVSTSYGPGRYDPTYEEAGQDYPQPYVRWTENRNMAAYLHLVACGRIVLDGLSQRTWNVDQAAEAYSELSDAGSRPLLSLLQYPARREALAARLEVRTSPVSSGVIRVALVGAGSFAQAVHLPNLAKLKNTFALRAVVSRKGTTARSVAERQKAAYATTDLKQVLADPDIDLVIIATRHNLHADMTLAALNAGKHVFVEKPLATQSAQLDAIERIYAVNASAPMLVTGFNRRFSPAAMAARRILAERRSPAIVNYRMNAGFIPADHWVHGEEGGGRNIGEACHIYDLFNFLVGASHAEVSGAALVPSSPRFRRDDNFVATIRYEDGSVCSLTYTALGSSAYPKEVMEVFVDGMVLALDDYKSLKVFGGSSGGWQAAAADKGHFAEFEALATGLRTGGWPISLADQIAATRISFLVQQLVRQ